MTADDGGAEPGAPPRDTASAARRIAFVTFIGGLGGGMVFPIVPAVGLQLGIAGGMIGLILSANRISRLISDPWAGRVVDRVGGRIPVTVGLLVESIAILGYSGALHFGNPAAWFLAGRLLFGVGSALLLVGAQATVLGLSTRADRGRRIASVRVALTLGIPGGLVMSGLIADRFSDDTAFLTGATITFLGSVMALLLVPRGRPGAGGGHRAGSRGTPWKTRLRALAALPEFPFLATVWGFNLLVFLTVQGTLLATIVVLVHERGIRLAGLADKGTAGLVMGSMMACAAMAALVLGRVLDRLTLRATLVVPSLLVLGVGFATIALAHDAPQLVAGAVLVGLSVNGVSLPLLALLADVTRSDSYGNAVGIYQLFGDIGGSLGPIVGLEAGLHLGFGPTYLGAAALLLASLPVAVRVHRRERARRRAG